MANDCKILLIDDDELFCLAIKDGLSEFKIAVANTIEQGIKELGRRSFDILLLDSKLPDGCGLESLRLFREIDEQIKIIVITAYPDLKLAIQAIKDGAYDYLLKPIDLEELRVKIRNVYHVTELEKLEQLRIHEHSKREEFFVGSSSIIQNLRSLAAKAAASSSPILITGETGTGKNLIATLIHKLSARHKKPFVQVNCAALPEHLIEAELFGFERGTFTGAYQARYGLFELADQGTLLLDEITEMPLNLQSKILSAIETNEIRRLGSNKVRRVDVRIIAATNIDPETAVVQNKLRRDLYYRLNVLRIDIPPLRSHPEDIPELCQHFLRKLAPERKVFIPEEEQKVLQAYNFPGNVRELRNLIERSLILQTEEKELLPSQFILKSDILLVSTNETKSLSLAEIKPLVDIEKQYIELALRKMDYNITRTSKALGISISTLKRKIKLYGLIKKLRD
ncbi:MAG: sigma-54-dependent Fis family transcriptional regulator [Acidobacteria bacterium]|nr:MAG: sigma-54-dependent Fis family transcriptional regulator [Acidobacteriota bacterium]